MKCKKILAGFLSIVTSASMLLTTGTIATDDTYISVNQTEEPVVQSDEVMEIKASNSLGNYITNMVNQEEESVAQENQLEGYSITALEFDAETGIALVESSQKIACTVSVKIVTEDGKEITATEQKAVAGNDVITELKVNTSMLPENYRVTADLLDPLGNKCCSTFTCNDYTKEMQEIYEADVDDFEEEYVVNLDEDKSTNFMVLNEETVIADSTPEVNTLVSADYEEGVFVFENIDDTISELEQDDYFYTCSNEEDIIAIKVDSVKIKNGVATVKQSDENIDEMFDFIKIETISDDVSNVEIDTSTADSDIIITENEVDEEQEIGLGESVMSTTRTNNVKVAASASHSLSLSTEIEKGVFKLSPKISLGAKINFNFYKRWNYVNIKFSISTPLTVSLKISASSDNLVSETCSINQGFGVMNVPTGVPGVYVKMEPKFCVEFSGTLSCTYTTEPEFGFIYDSVTGMSSINKSGEENSDLSVELKGKAFIGVEFEPKCVVLSESIAKFGVKAKMGVEISGELSYVSSSDGESVEGSSNLFCFDSSGDTIHTCTACVDGSVNFIFNASVELTVLTVRASLDIANISVPIADKFYFSDKLGFGIGECPNKGYKTIFKITNSSGSPLSSYKIQVENVELKTKSDGTASVYARNGTYYYDVYDSLGYSVYRGRVEVYNSKKTIPVVIDNSGNVTIGTPQEVVITTTTVSTAPPITTTTETTISTASKLDILEAGKLGDNITYILYNDGYMWIYGYGDMYDSSSSPISNREKVIEVEIENEDEENGKVITSIGSYVFWGCSNLPSITIPDSVISIGEGAFSGCSGFTEITLPPNLKNLGAAALRDCSGIKNIVVPDTVESIGKYVFANCTSLESMTLPFAGENKEVVAENYNSVYSLFDWCFNAYYDALPKKLTSITITGGNCIPGGTFESINSLIEVNLPNTITSIGDYAFYDCTSLETIVINNPDCEIYDSEYTISDTATIYGYRNSTAQAYAEKYNRKFVALDEADVTTTAVTTNNPTTETTISTTSSAKVTTSKNTTATTKATTTNLTTTTKQTTITTITTTKITTTTTPKPVNGDVNEDGIISIADVILIQKALVKANVNVDFSIVDINKDNKFNVFDLIIVKRMVLKK